MLTAVDAFCGAGGLSLGLRQAGFVVVGAFDKDAAAVSTARHNSSHPVLLADATTLRGDQLAPGYDPGSVDLVAGGPPCQGFSEQNKQRSPDDARSQLVFEFARLVNELRPRAFLTENVKGLSTKRNTALHAALLERFHAYAVESFVCNSIDYGVAQARERSFLVGFLRSLKVTFRGPLFAPNHRTIADAFRGLPEPCLPEAGPYVANHTARALGPKSAERAKHIPPGGGWRDLPPELMMDAHRRQLARGVPPGKGWTDVYGRLEWNKPAPTLTTGFADPTKGRYLHPSRDRTITPREAARLQGFPDDYVFMGARTQQARQIGNAVPVPLARAWGKALVGVLGGGDT